MEKYWVTFRVADGPGYDARYGGLVEAVNEILTHAWAETTSFWLLETEWELDAVAQRLCAPLDADKDLLVIRYLAKDGSRYFGKVEDLAALKTFLPKIKKVG